MSILEHLLKTIHSGRSGYEAADDPVVGDADVNLDIGNGVRLVAGTDEINDLLMADHLATEVRIGPVAPQQEHVDLRTQVCPVGLKPFMPARAVHNVVEAQVKIGCFRFGNPLIYPT